MAGAKEGSSKAITISRLARKPGSKTVDPDQGVLDLSIEVDTEISGIGMGVLSDGTPYLNQRGLATLCGVENAHIGTISGQWNDKEQKPRIKSIKKILSKYSLDLPAAHVEVYNSGVKNFCYISDVCLAILEYYAFDAGSNFQEQARDNFRLLAGSKLREMIYSHVGYEPKKSHGDEFKKWHDRLALNYQSAPKGFFHVFNEAGPIIYELIMAGAPIGDKFVVDISIGLHWSAFWIKNNYCSTYGDRKKWPHRYPDDHPQAKSNPQESWCYPLTALGEYRNWLQDEYIEGGKFRGYLQTKVSRGEIAPSIAQLAIDAIEPKRISGPKK